MRVDIVGSPAELQPKIIKGKNVAVIDVLRATTVIVTALQNGAIAIIPKEHVEDARQCYTTIMNTGVLLGGERNAVKIEGFHLANSPFEYTKEVVDGKTIILTTSNGTRALTGSVEAKNVTIASFLNATAIGNWLGNEGEDVTIVCAGSAESYTLEDALCAGMIASILSERFAASLSDYAFTLMHLYKGFEGNLMSALENCHHAQLLIKKGFIADVSYCMQKDISGIIPKLSEGIIAIS
ncbi:MAG TPA: 2-phosphosulfolactate phosphatase [Williamwhitmania sp.]|nr:2-phosphosulfolactate phosphatase [Williamwhitmania sp.]